MSERSDQAPLSENIPAVRRVRGQVKASLNAAIAAAAAAGHLPAGVPAAARVQLEVPRDRTHGDLATNVAMTVASAARQNPRQIAETIVKHIDTAGTYIDAVEVAGPGFINCRLRPDWLHLVIADILSAGPEYGRSSFGGGKRVLLEFVSANPTGPLNVVNARHAALGDALARLLEATGHDVHTEFYVNDAGNQVRMLGIAMETRLRQLLGEDAELPEGAYPGEYVIALAQKYLDGNGAGVLQDPEEEKLRRLARFAVDHIVEDQRQVLRRFGVEFDRWFHETEVRDSGAAFRVIEKAEAAGHVYEEEGARWLATSRFGDDKDWVMVKRDGELTYLVPDMAYHEDKIQRGSDLMITLLGRDHYGYHVRMKAALAALGHDPDLLEVIYLQMVHLMSRGQAVRMSKRQGQFVELADFLDEVSPEAARYFFLSRSSDTEVEFDLDLANLQTQENPVYYVQYAHARMAGILRQAREQGASFPTGADDALALAEQGTVWGEPAEQDLIRLLAELPQLMEDAAAAREPHRLVHYAHELATVFHQFYTRSRVLGAGHPAQEARLVLVHAAGIVLRRVLGLLGIGAPERM